MDTREIILNTEGNATIEIDCSNATLGTSGILEGMRINVTSTGINTLYIDSIELICKEGSVTPEEPAGPTYTVVKAFNFDSTAEGFQQGGSLNMIQAVDGTLLATAGDTLLRIWTPYVNLATTDVTHLRVMVKTTATDPQFRAYGEFDNVTTDAINYAGVAYASGTEDYQEIIIDLTAAESWSTKTELDRLCIYPFSNNVGETATIDSVEFLKLVTE